MRMVHHRQVDHLYHDAHLPAEAERGVVWCEPPNTTDLPHYYALMETLLLLNIFLLYTAMEHYPTAPAACIRANLQ